MNHSSRLHQFLYFSAVLTLNQVGDGTKRRVGTKRKFHLGTETPREDSFEGMFDVSSITTVPSRYRDL
jgi:hypothetical protein